jgi:hypothetical protein
MLVPNVLKAGLGCSGEKGSPPEAESIGCTKFRLSGSDMPGGAWPFATSEAESSAHSALDRGWTVAKAGPATTIIAAIIVVTVSNKIMRFMLSASSSCRASLVSPAVLRNEGNLACA